jgi:glycosyltransferase involved in cell wall biosynthesis
MMNWSRPQLQLGRTSLRASVPTGCALFRYHGTLLSQVMRSRLPLSKGASMVSVIMATYNRAPTLPRAVNSVLRQSLSDLELIIVDDGSTDDWPRFLSSITDPRVVVCSHRENRGVTAARNTGLGHIRGEWFTFCDSDDEMTPNALSVMVECAARTGATAITCNCTDYATGRMTGIGPTQDGRLSTEETARSCGDHWGLTKTSLLGDMRFDERLPGLEGVLWLKINRIARRYYVHRALSIVHTEGLDRVTVAHRRAGIRDKVRLFCVLGEDRAYLEALRTANPRSYRLTMLRVWVARFLHWVAFKSERW